MNYLSNSTQRISQRIAWRIFQWNRSNRETKASMLILSQVLALSFGFSLELILAKSSLAQATVAPTLLPPSLVKPDLIRKDSPAKEQPNSSSVKDNPSNSQSSQNSPATSKIVPETIQEMITPVAIAGGSPAPLLVSQDRARVAAENLYQAVQMVLDTEDRKLSYLQINNTFDAYNNLIVLLGLTEPAQIENFPRLKSIGLALASLREKVTPVKLK